MYLLSVGNLNSNQNIETVETDGKKVELYEVFFNDNIYKVPKPIFNVWQQLLIGGECQIIKDIWLKESGLSEYTLQITLEALMIKENNNELD